MGKCKLGPSLALARPTSELWWLMAFCLPVVDAKCGAACHTIVKSKDYFFTQYAKRP